MKNPLTMRGSLADCWLFAFRAPLARLLPLVPPPLEPISRDGFGFWNVVVCHVNDLRPAPLPALFGISYWHVAYRLCVKVRLASGRTLEGLYFVRNEFDRPLIASLGRGLSGFDFQPVSVHVDKSPVKTEGSIDSPSHGSARFYLAPKKAPVLAEGSPFTSLEEAAGFLKYQPCALFPSAAARVEILKVSRDESRWKSRPVRIESSQWPFLKDQDAHLELCSEIAPIEYQWNRGEMLEVAA